MLHTEQITFQKNPNTLRINLLDMNLTKAGESKTKINQRNNLLKKNKDNIAYKLLIKKIAFQLKKRTKLPKCKIFKFYLSYRLLVQRIAKRLKATAKKLNFWEKNDIEMTMQDVDQIQEIASTAIKIIQKQGKKNQRKKNITSSGRQKNKSPKVKLTLLKKSEEEKLNKDKNNINMIVEDKKGKNRLQNILNDLKNIQINKKDMNTFMKKFGAFMQDNNIEIIRDNKLPRFTHKEDEYLLTQKGFWIKYIIYISEKYKNELNLFIFINFIEQFYLWCKDPGDSMDFIVEIKLQIYKIFDEQKINDFLSINKLEKLDQLFERYKNLNSEEEKENIIETKVDITNCTCPTCTQKGYIQKVIDYNNSHNQISFAKKNNLYYSPMSQYIKFDKSKTLHNNGQVDIEYSILANNKYYDNNVFNFLNKIEKGKAESEKKKKRNTSTKKKTSEKKMNKEQTIKIQEVIEIDEEKKSNKNNKNKKAKKGKNDRIIAILDLMSLDDVSDNE